MKLNLKRPMVFFDLETTGTSVSADRIVEISMVKVMPDGEKIVKTRRVNPEMPIPAEATAVHHITDEDVRNEPTFKQLAKSLREFILGCDFGGFNSNSFDLPLLAEEFLRAGVDAEFLKEDARYIDVQTIFHKKEERTLVAAYRFYCDKNLEAAHSAEADTMATYEVLCAQLDRYADLDNDVDKLAAFSTRRDSVDFAGRIVRDENGVAIFSFGKHRDKPVAEVFRREPSYYTWIMEGDFPAYTKEVCRKIYNESKLSQNPNIIFKR